MGIRPWREGGDHNSDETPTEQWGKRRRNFCLDGVDTDPHTSVTLLDPLSRRDVTLDRRDGGKGGVDWYSETTLHLRGPVRPTDRPTNWVTLRGSDSLWDEARVRGSSGSLGCDGQLRTDLRPVSPLRRLGEQGRDETTYPGVPKPTGDSHPTPPHLRGTPRRRRVHASTLRRASPALE